MTYMLLERLKMKRKQYEVAEALNVSQTYICNLEKGKEIPSQEFSEKLENYYRQPIDYLLKEVK